MHLRTLFTLLCLPVLAACQLNAGRLLPDAISPQNPAASPESIHWERRALCGRDDCTLVNVATLHYPDEPALDALINQALLSQANAPKQADSDQPLDLYTDTLFQRHPVGREVWLQAKQVEARGDLVVIELASFLKTGENGWPGRGFIHYSRQLDRSLQPSELLLPGQEFAFWNLARKAHLVWMQREGLLQNPQFQQRWPFRRTQNVALLADRVRIKYEVDSIAPMPMGHPVLDIPYSQLEGILRPEFMPQPPSP